MPQGVTLCAWKHDYQGAVCLQMESWLDTVLQALQQSSLHMGCPRTQIARPLAPKASLTCQATYTVENVG